MSSAATTPIVPVSSRRFVTESDLSWLFAEARPAHGPFPGRESRRLEVRAPVGPCLIVTSWNVLPRVPGRSVGPAPAAGCAVVLRPSALAPLSAPALGRILIGAGIPVGVLNLVRVSCVTAPFGGVRHEDLSRSGGPEGIEEYLATRYLTMPTGGGVR